MVIDNKLEISKIRLMFTILLALVFFSILFFVLKELNKPVPISLITGIVCFILHMACVFIGLKYIYFNDTSDKLIFRHMDSHPFVRKRRAIQIPKNTFAGYEITSTLGGLRRILILKQLTKKGIANYAPLNITAMRNKDIRLIESSLQKHLDYNKQILKKHLIK